MINFKEIKETNQVLATVHKIDSNELDGFMSKHSALIGKYDEYVTKSYIDVQRHSDCEEANQRQHHVHTVIKPALNELKRHVSRITLQSIEDEHHVTRLMRNRMNLYHEENVELLIEEDQLIQRYLQTIGQLTDPTDDSKSIAGLQGDLYDADESIRKQAFTNMYKAYVSKEDDITKCLKSLIQNREQQARRLNNNGYRELAFMKLGRLDYDAEDCLQFANQVSKHFEPLRRSFQQLQTKKLKKSKLSPWDSLISPFSDHHDLSVSPDDLIVGTERILNELDPYFGKLFFDMRAKGHLDLSPRPNKAEGGFCESLPDSKSSFIFMNSFGGFDDFIVLLHEMGHAIHHDFSQQHLFFEAQIISFEVGEFVAMSLELFSMNHWAKLFSDERSLIQAKLEQFRLMIEFLPSVFIVDQFQHNLYDAEKNMDPFNEIFERLVDQYETDLIDWNDVSDLKGKQWMRVIHLFETPFYYIEYALAQIAALRMYMQYRQHPDDTLNKYKNALALGGTASIPETYHVAGVSLFPSEEELVELTEFLKAEIEQLMTQLNEID
ncbi:M3 family metallopeptidase [Exiguobacterium aestuarii]|uniref:M3 family metallopeptidase n=1 Tax=Exiguobacterium aestuarii TaxID=273527 RepID=A0ABW2PMY5_9BACL|nr:MULTISPECIES: M3 family metallopeptidase [Exiguobacterium]MCT4784798.1 M3 family metallopeptidase [Exiguobacterium aestuarii]